jgi:hypothetical protein
MKDVIKNLRKGDPALDQMVKEASKELLTEQKGK